MEREGKTEATLMEVEIMCCNAFSMVWDLFVSQMEHQNSSDLGKSVNKSMKYLHQKCHQAIWRNSVIIINAVKAMKSFCKSVVWS